MRSNAVSIGFTTPRIVRSVEVHSGVVYATLEGERSGMPHAQLERWDEAVAEAARQRQEAEARQAAEAEAAAAAEAARAAAARRRAEREAAEARMNAELRTPGERRERARADERERRAVRERGPRERDEPMDYVVGKNTTKWTSSKRAIQYAST